MWRINQRIPQTIVRDDGLWSRGDSGGASDWQYCNEGEIAVSGGGECPYPAFTFKSVPTPDGRGWIHDCDDGTGSGWAPARAYAVCMPRQ
nr:hypothetical protein [Pseudomonas aeruginosa]